MFTVGPTGWIRFRDRDVYYPWTHLERKWYDTQAEYDADDRGVRQDIADRLNVATQGR